MKTLILAAALVSLSGCNTAMSQDDASRPPISGLITDGEISIALGVPRPHHLALANGTAPTVSFNIPVTIKNISGRPLYHDAYVPDYPLTWIETRRDGQHEWVVQQRWRCGVPRTSRYRYSPNASYSVANYATVSSEKFSIRICFNYQRSKSEPYVEAVSDPLTLDVPDWINFGDAK